MVSVRGAVIVEKSCRNLRYHPMVPRNLRTSFVFLGGLMFKIISILLWSGLSYLPPMI